MIIGAELGRHILQTHNSQKLWRFDGGWTPWFTSGYASVSVNPNYDYM